MSKSRSGAPKRVAAGLLAGALTVFGLAFAPHAGATDDVSTDRYAGVTRYSTAGAVAGQADFAGATVAILATGENFPDALAASGIAGGNTPAPIVLTESGVYSSEAQDALAALPVLTDVIIVGGTAAITDAVQAAVEDDGYAVTRLAGVDRYETAAEIARELGAAAIGQIGGLTTALIATGENFADALAGGTIAYANQMPILLVHPNEVPAATEAALGDLGIQQVVILGGTAAVSDDVQTSLEGIVGAPAIRVADLNRFGTAADIAQFGVDELGWDPTEVLLANGLNFPDALAGGPLGGGRQAPILLLASVPDETAAFLDLHSDTITNIECLGGTAACSEEDLAGAETAAEIVDNDEGVNATGTNRPELVSATFVETITATFATAARPAGTYVKYTFDEPVTGVAPVATKFKVYNADGSLFIGTAGANTLVTETDNKTVEVYFNTPGGALDTVAEAANLTLATVDDGAATGISGTTTNGLDTNLEGDALITPGGTATAATAGITAAPDLLSVGNFRAGTTADVTSVDFTFDEAAFNQAINGYHLVGTGGNSVLCTGDATGAGTTPSGGTIPGGNGTTVQTVNCQEAPGGATFSATSIVRGYVDAATVDDLASLAGNENPLESADVSAGGVSDGPDLSLIVYSADAVDGVDTVVYIYDESVSATVGAASLFRIYSTTGASTGSFAAARSSENNSAVTTFFTNNTLSGATFVGGSSGNNAVSDLQANFGVADEEGTSPSAGATTTAGLTDGPDLTSVTVNPVTSAFGTAGFTVTYTFDEDTADTSDDTAIAGDYATANPQGGEEVVLAGLHLYTSDGIRLDCKTVSGSVTGLVSNTTALTNRAEDADHKVVCSSFTVAGGAIAATAAQVGSGIVGTVEGAVAATVNTGAVADETAAGGDTSPEGGALTTGGTGTPAT